MNIQVEKIATVCTDGCCATPTPGIARKALDRSSGSCSRGLQARMDDDRMDVEAVVAITSGITAGSLVLTAFGLDSGVELASAGIDVAAIG